jgi:hypothetical protein
MATRIRKLKEKVRFGYWTYFEPAWWHWRWRGGRFVMVREITGNNKDENGDHYLQCMDELSEADGGEGYMKWTLNSYTEWGNFYEVFTVRFRTKDDAMMFKLAWA